MIFFSNDDRAMLENHLHAAIHKHPEVWSNTYNMQEMACLVAEECGELVREANNWREIIEDKECMDKSTKLRIQSALFREAWQLMAVTYRMIIALREEDK